MAQLERGNAPVKTLAASKGTLSLRQPHIESLVTGLGIDGQYLEDVRRFAKTMTVDRSRWDIERRSRGLFSGGQLKPADAEKALTKALTAMHRNNSQNTKEAANERAYS